MQNDFEKQVRQKMEELDLVPSPPVWEKIEEQIRSRKDRRRLIFWLPLVGLLLAGGIWLTTRTAKETSDQITARPGQSAERHLPVNKGADASHGQIPYGKKSVDPSAEKSIDDHSTKTPSKKTGGDEDNLIGRSGNKTINQRNLDERSSMKLHAASKKHLTKNNRTAFAPENSEAGLHAQTDKPRKDQPDADKLQQIPDTAEAIHEKSPEEKISGEKKDSMAPGGAINEKDTIAGRKPDPKKPDSTAAQKEKAVQKVVNRSKWELAVTAGGGITGFGKGFQLSMEKADRPMPAFSSAPRPPLNLNSAAYIRPPDEQKGSYSFSAGLLAERQLNKKFRLSTGLEYHFYSTIMEVGNRIKKDTALYMADFGDVRVESFYGGPATSARFRPYRNQYHFLALPVSVDYRLFKNLPIRLQAGGGVQYLVGTNALQYNDSARVYHQYDKAMEKLLFFYEAGLSYRFKIGENGLSAGPYFKSSFNSLWKNAERRLVQFGLRAKMTLAKK